MNGVQIDVPSPQDHCNILAVVRLIGAHQDEGSSRTLNQIFERIKRVRTVVLSDHPRRSLAVRYIPSYSTEWNAWGDFQCHRRALCLVCVGLVTESASNVALAAPDIVAQHRTLSQEYQNTLVDSRCFLIGCSAAPVSPPATEVPQSNGHVLSVQNLEDGAMPAKSTRNKHAIVCYNSMDEARDLETQLREFLESLFWILESKRLDRWFESNPPNLTPPFAPGEEKFRVGLDSNKTGKVFRKRCLGRYRKQTGQVALAVDTYNDAIEKLKAVNDWLWLAGALEGCACACTVLRYDMQPPTAKSSLHRVATFTPGEMKSLQASIADQGTLPRSPSARGHNRNASYDSKLTAKEVLLAEDILDNFRSAIENYQKFSFAASIELECIFKAARIYILEGDYMSLNEFLVLHTEKFLIDDRVEASTKSYVCGLLCAVYREVGFRRKMALFQRLAAMYRIKSVQNSQPNGLSTTDYRHVYPMYLETLQSYNLPLNSRDLFISEAGGWTQCQSRVLHELYLAAKRGGLLQCAIRHLCYLIQALMYDLPAAQLQSFCKELQDLCQQHTPSVTHIRVNNAVVLPPVPLTLLPRVIHFEVLPLPAYLAPTEVRRLLPEEEVFIYTPLYTKRAEKKRTRWTEGCASEILVRMNNPLDFELNVENLTLLCDGCACEAIPVNVILSPNQANVEIRLLVIPKASGQLQIAGYRCESFGVPSICRLRDCPWLKQDTINLEVTPRMPVLAVTTNFERQDSTSHVLETCNAHVELRIGESMNGNIVLRNNSSEAVKKLNVVVEQPQICADDNLLQMTSTPAEMVPIEAGMSCEIGVQLTGIDFCSKYTRFATNEVVDAETLFDIPDEVYTVVVKLSYGTGAVVNFSDQDTNSQPDIEFERHCAVVFHVRIRPVLVILHASILPGDSVSSRYMMLRLLNISDHEVEIAYATNKQMHVDAGDVCQLPVPIVCCDSGALVLAGLTSSAERVLTPVQQKRVLQLCRQHLKREPYVCWRMPAKQLCGVVPIWNCVTSMELCRRLLQPPLLCQLNIDGKERLNQEEHACEVGTQVCMDLELDNPNDSDLQNCEIRMSVYMDLQNGSVRQDVAGLVVVIGSTKSCLGKVLNHSKRCAQFVLLFCGEGQFKVDLSCRCEVENDDAVKEFKLAPSVVFSVLAR